MTTNRHLTTRRRFITAFGFGGVSLYGLWAAYGAAPGPLTLLGLGDAHAEIGGGGHDSHGAAGGPGVEEFRRLTEAFVAEYQTPDGSVYPRRRAAAPAHDAHGGMPAASPPAAHGAAADLHGSHDMTMAAPAGGDHSGGPAQADGHADMEEAALDVYLMAEKWSFEPAHLRLDAGVPYRFRMMASDVSHGASIQLGRGGRMIRLRPNSLSEMEATFTKPGSYLVYCTVYCGQAHDFMRARIDVV